MFLGVFQAYYDLELLVRAFLSLQRTSPALQLHLFGDGPQFAAVETAKGNADSVVLHGRYDLKALLQSDVLRDSIVLVLPNKARGMSDIGSPIKLYEYMSFGLPILAARVGQAQEVLVQDETACFYEAGREDSCIEAMRRLAADEALRRRLASNVKLEFERNHTWDKRAAALVDAFRARRSEKRNE
jgi:glycosyltransferase involved in cell wall biosynthesis